MEKIPYKDLHIVSLTNRHELKFFNCKSDDYDKVKGFPYPKYPSIKIARLAVDIEYERRYIGSFLFLAAIGAAMSVSDIIGCRYLTVDSKTDSIDFYKKLHFKIVEKYKKTDFQKMYIDMYPIIAAMRPKETLEKFEN